VIDFLTWIEASALGQLMRQSGPWTYPIVNLVHIFGISTLFGSVVVLDVALIRAGFTRKMPPQTMAAIARGAAPLAGAGLVLAAVSGIGLLASNATEYIGNPFFVIKFPVIALGLANALMIRRSQAWQTLQRGVSAPADTRRLAWMSVGSLFTWSAAISAGRMIGYW
jgi:hypothetical protein